MTGLADCFADRDALAKSNEYYHKIHPTEAAEVGCDVWPRRRRRLKLRRSLPRLPRLLLHRRLLLLGAASSASSNGAHAAAEIPLKAEQTNG